MSDRESDQPVPSEVASPSVAVRRRQRYRQEMIDDILGTARAVMREDGVGALNLNEVARRLGVSSQALAKYFPNKHAVYDALFRLGTQIMRERVQTLNAGRAADPELLTQGIELTMEFAHEYPELYHLCFERPVPGFHPSPESMAEAQALLELIGDTIRRGMDAGTIAHRLSPVETVDLYSALVHGLTSLHMANQPDVPPGQGRFGSLIPATQELLAIFWGPDAMSSLDSSRQSHSFHAGGHDETG
jgi:AcrR family transcriptional regulator